MTIDEFMADIAPKMRPGWVAMDKDERWFWFENEPNREDLKYAWFNYKGRCMQCNLCAFDIDPVDDWTQSLRKVGCNE